MFLRIDEPAPAAAESPTNRAQPGSTTNEEPNSSASNAGNLTDLECYRRSVEDAVASYERQTRMLSELRRNMAVPDMYHLQTDEVVRDEAARLSGRDESAPTREQHEETAHRADERVMEEYRTELAGRLGQQPLPGSPRHEAAWGDTAWYRHQNELEMTRQLHESLSRMAPRLGQDRDIREYQKALLSSLPPRAPAPASPEPEEQDGVVGRDHIQRHYTDEEFLRICEEYEARNR